MTNLTRTFEHGGAAHSLEMVFVEGTRGRPYRFGEEGASLNVEVFDFYISTVPVTQALWAHVAGANPSVGVGVTFVGSFPVS